MNKVTEKNEKIFGEIKDFGEHLPSYNALSTTTKAISTLFKLSLGRSKHMEHFHQDFKNLYDTIQPLAEKIHDKMREFKQEKEEISKQIQESAFAENEKKDYHDLIKEIYDRLEEWLIPIPFRLQKMEDAIQNIKTEQKSPTNFVSRKANFHAFMQGFNDVALAIAIYKTSMEVLEDTQDEINSINDKVNLSESKKSV